MRSPEGRRPLGGNQPPSGRRPFPGATGRGGGGGNSPLGRAWKRFDKRWLVFIPAFFVIVLAAMYASIACTMDDPGSIILGKKGALRIPSTDCWNGSVGGPMTLYHDVAGSQVETVIPVLENNDFGGLFYRKIRSFLDAVKFGGAAPVPASQILYNQAIIDGITRSAGVGREIEINIPEI